MWIVPCPLCSWRTSDRCDSRGPRPRGRIRGSCAPGAFAAWGEFAAPSPGAWPATPANAAGALGQGDRTGAGAAGHSPWCLAGRVTTCQTPERGRKCRTRGRCRSRSPPAGWTQDPGGPAPRSSPLPFHQGGASQQGFRTGWVDVTITPERGHKWLSTALLGTIRSPHEPAHCHLGAGSFHFSEALSSVKLCCGVFGVVTPAANVAC